jgi:hypothetical protein
MYYILDIENNPPTIVPGVSFQTEEEACNWIDLSGVECPACKYTVIKE